MEIYRNIWHFFNRTNQDCSYHVLGFLQKILRIHILVFVYVAECKIVISEQICSGEVYPKIATGAGNSPSENLVWLFYCAVLNVCI